VQPIKQPVKKSWGDHWWQLLIVGLVLCASLLRPALASAPNSAPNSTAPFNQPDFYPIAQTLSDQYRSVGEWVGRLILPPPDEQKADWVEFEIYQAPPAQRGLIGETVQLTWQPVLAPQVEALTRQVEFTAAIRASQQKGNIHPERLNGQRVGPLQSLAGARAEDDVIVSLPDVIVAATDPPSLQIGQPPVLQTGRYYTLVKILASVPTDSLPLDCPEPKPCPSELFQVQHYSPKTRQFDGPVETMRIPQQPRSAINLFNSTPRSLEQSPAGQEGWYLYGAQDQRGLFTVQAIKPRALFQVQPQQVRSGASAVANYLNSENWGQTRQQQGRLQTTLAALNSKTPAKYQVGQRFLVMHLFGGRGGERGESPLLGTVTGHFAYGIAEVIREPLADELQFDLRYYQIYGSNVEGIISGTHAWTNYMGSLKSGWLYTRPVSDILIDLDLITQPYQLGAFTLSPLAILQQELQTIAARYRIGDGIGGAIITPATSCVQDSNQALFITIQRLRQQVANHPDLRTWLAADPDHPEAKRFQRLVALGQDLEATLMPLGIVRQDWQDNAEVLAGTGQFTHLGKGIKNILAGLTSWRTLLPRSAQDDLSALFLRHGAQLWFLRTNQVGGTDPNIWPIAPTRQFGTWTVFSIPVLSILLDRLIGSLRLLTGSDLKIMALALLTYAALALPYGLQTQFLQTQFLQWRSPSGPTAMALVKLFLFPALAEELLFRVLLLPYPGTSLTPFSWWSWAMLSLGLFVIYHPFNAKTFYPAGNPTFLDARFLLLATWLGIVCTVAYYITQSWLVITLIHWLIVTVWIFGLGGKSRLYPAQLKL
jgi:predicted Abi (CAAX) family protease